MTGLCPWCSKGSQNLRFAGFFYYSQGKHTPVVSWTAAVIRIDVNMGEECLGGKNSVTWVNLHSPVVFFSLRQRNHKENSKLLFPADFYSHVTVYKYKLYANEKWGGILMPIHLAYAVSRHIWRTTAAGCFHKWDSVLFWITMFSIFLTCIC